MGEQYVGIDLHRRRSVIVRMTPAGEGHCCIWRSLASASSTRVPERHLQCPGLVALSTSKGDRAFG
jgi:hypothetical protein